MSDLATWYLAQLDEDEKAALQWSENEREWQSVGRRRLFYDNGCSEDVSAIDVTNRAADWWERIYVKRDLDGLTDHIARHDPAHVLADIAAKRRIVAEHANLNAEWDPDEVPPVCRVCRDRRRHDAAAWPCTTLHLLALFYADRPGYYQAWAPGEES